MAKKLSDDDFKAIVGKAIEQSIGFLDDEIQDERRKAMDLYYGLPFGNEVEGRSHVVSTDVQDIIESVLPDFMEIFAGSDEVISVEPVSKEDVETADQAADYIQHVWTKDNDGFQVTYDVIKDALLQKTGIAKVWWDDTPITRKMTLMGLNSVAMQEIAADEDIEFLEHTENAVDPMISPDGVLHDVTIRRTVMNGKVRVASIPPEDFLISPDATDDDILIGGCKWLGHRYKSTASELIERGFDAKKVESIPDWSGRLADQEYQARRPDEPITGFDSLDDATRDVDVFEMYLLVDRNGDGIAELIQVTAAGTGYLILEEQEVDDHPFVTIACIPMPHKFFGRSLADLAEDIQRINSALWRNILDNAYLVNNARSAVSNKVDLDDWLENRPGGMVRVDTDNADAGGHIAPMMTVPLAQHLLPVMEHANSVRETRTGVTRYNQGLDANSLNKTATGINQILNQSQKRKLLMARFMAQGFRRAFKKILKLLIDHQDAARTIRLRNEWVPMDPRSWNADMDVTVNVGLGHGTKESQAMADQVMLNVMKEVIMLQGGIQGPLVTEKEIHYIAKRFAANQGYSDPDLVFADPASEEMQQKMQMLAQQKAQAPNPDVMKVQGQLQAQQMKDQGTLQLAQQKAQAEIAMKREMGQADMGLKRQEMAGELQLDREKAQQEFRLEIMKTMLEIQADMAAMKARMGMEARGQAVDYALRARGMQSDQDLKRAQAAADAQLQRETAYEGDRT